MTYAQVGVNRTLGVQDFDDKVMQAVNRVQDLMLFILVVNHSMRCRYLRIQSGFYLRPSYQTVRSLTCSMDYAFTS